MLTHWLAILRALLADALILLAGLGLGGLFGRWFAGLPRLTLGETLALRLLAGLGCLGVTLFLVGQICFSPACVVTIVILACGLNLVFPWSPRGLRAEFPTDRLSQWCWCFAALVVVYMAGAALDRPVGDSTHDAIRYHLLGPVKYLREGTIRPELSESHTAFPATIEMLFAASMALANDRAPALLDVVFFALLLSLTSTVAKSWQLASPRPALAVALLTAMPVASSTVGSCFVDVPYAAFGLAGAWIAFGATSRRSYALAGVFAGLAVGTKYPGLALLGITAFFLLLGDPFGVPTRSRWAGVFVFVGVALVLASPWYLRNALLLGNPIYPPPPLLAKLWPASTFPLESSIHLKNYIAERGQGFGKTPAAFFALPFNFTFRTEYFHGAGGIGLAPLALAPVGLWLLRASMTTGRWFAWCFALVSFWFVTQQEARFIVVVLPIAAMLAAHGACVLNAACSLWGRCLVFAVLGVSLLYGAASALSVRAAQWHAVVSPAFARQRWQQMVPRADAVAWLNEHAEVSRVLLTSHAVPPYYLHKNFVVLSGPLGERPFADIRNLADALPHLDRLQISHVLDAQEDPLAFVWPTQGPGKLVAEGPGYRIFQIAAQPRR